jgi:16S rRNA (cytidine1402-2'-O)-methyltransferase
MTARAGKLVLVGTPLGNAGDLSPRAAQAITTADVVACEDTRHTRKLLAVAGIEPQGRMLSLHQHNEQARAEQVTARVAAGQVVALVTDAGMPGVSDPGERVVRAVLDAGLAVETVPGPTAATTALALSGLPSDRFCFEGFLPRKGRERKDRLAAIAAEARTTVAYEAPHRLVETIADLAAICGGERRIAIARELTKLYEEVWRGTLGDAVAHTEAVAPRGEYTLVVEGSAARPPASSDDVAAAVAAHLAAGMSRKDAAAAVAAELGVPKRVAYDAANRRPGAGEPQHR